jgi:hypothetical protein
VTFLNPVHFCHDMSFKSCLLLLAWVRILSQMTQNGLLLHFSKASHLTNRNDERLAPIPPAFPLDVLYLSACSRSPKSWFAHSTLVLGSVRRDMGDFSPKAKNKVKDSVFNPRDCSATSD